jgi:hypothetical protein
MYCDMFRSWYSSPSPNAMRSPAMTKLPLVRARSATMADADG